MAGIFIGGFAIFVGMFSVANIMFVSVKERTNIIGIKKALGAKKHVILIEFLVESIVLCLIGGLVGLLFVYLASLALTALFQFDIFLSYQNIMIGISLAAISGVLSGIIPALRAANMEPVEAMRSK
jgi:putative ABC transport system permease protein